MPSKLPNALISTISPHLTLGKSRLETLSLLIILLVNVRTVNLTHIASQFLATAKATSSYRRLQRFFQFVRLDEDCLARAVVTLSKVNPPWILCLDRTNWKLGKSNVNIEDAVHRHEAPSHSLDVDPARQTGQQQWCRAYRPDAALSGAFWRRIDPLSACRPRVHRAGMDRFPVADKVMFSIRVKANMAVVLETGRTHLLETLLRKRDGRTLLRKHEGRFATMPSNLGTPLRFACKELDNGELLIIVSNSENPSEALRVYKRRWFIECLFRDGKSGGLNMEDTHLTDLEKLSLLTAIVTLAMVWSYACARRKMGRRGIAKGPHGYLRKSWFRTGFDLLRNWILHSQDKAAEVWTTLWPNAKKPLQFVRVV